MRKKRWQQEMKGAFFSVKSVKCHVFNKHCKRVLLDNYNRVIIIIVRKRMRKRKRRMRMSK